MTHAINGNTLAQITFQRKLILCIDYISRLTAYSNQKDLQRRERERKEKQKKLTTTAAAIMTKKKKLKKNINSKITGCPTFLKHTGCPTFFKACQFRQPPRNHHNAWPLYHVTCTMNCSKVSPAAAVILCLVAP